MDFHLFDIARPHHEQRRRRRLRRTFGNHVDAVIGASNRAPLQKHGGVARKLGGQDDLHLFLQLEAISTQVGSVSVKGIIAWA